MSDIHYSLTAWVAGLMLLLVSMATPGHATTVTFGFTDNITDANPYVGNQLFVDIATTADPAKVSFTFRNTGPIASFIGAIYLVNSPLLFSNSPAPNIGNHTGVQFNPGASPDHLPGPSGSGFDKDSIWFSADAHPAANGINPGESLEIVFALLGGFDFNSVIDAVLANTLRLGLHVQGITGKNGGSDSYVLTTTPLPGALPLFATGLVSFSFLRRWRKKRNMAMA